MTTETRFPTSNTGTWNTPTNAYSDDNNYAYCGNGQGGRTHDYSSYGFTAVGNISEVRVDVKGYSGDGTKHTVIVYVWDGSSWNSVGTITSETQCFAHQFDVSSYINTVAKLNSIETRIESIGLSGGSPGSRYVRVCWIPVYADWSEGVTPGWNQLQYTTEPASSGWNRLKYISEPPVPSAFNKLAYLGE